MDSDAIMCSSTAIDWTGVSLETARQTLKDWRESNTRRSEEVVELWEYVISRNPSELNDELWLVYEQVCVAALDCARLEISKDCIRALEHRFPNSNRVMKLSAMMYEAVEKYDTANEIYDRLIEAEPTNNTFRKRKVAVLIAQGKTLDAIRELNEYLKVFLNDSEAWLQLSELFLAENDFAKAAHCLEECVLAAPLNTLYLRRLGDIRYSQGGQENVELARAYYEQAAKLNPVDMRALFGIVLCANYMQNHTKGSAGDKKKEIIGAGSNAADKIIARYEECEANGENPEIPGIIDSVRQMKTALMTTKQ